MQKRKVFISSVQSEFSAERQVLYDYLTADALLGRFFEPFLFENVPALNAPPSAVFLNEERIRKFAEVAHRKRSFPFDYDSPIVDVLTHLNLIKGDRVTNAALLLFADKPQRYFITSEVKCAHFHGFSVSKPIPSYQVFKGTVFEMINAAVDFVLSKINLYVGDRSKSVIVDTIYELPMPAVTEAIVNAVAHRDYTSNGSVQVMLFTDRLEVANPGRLPVGLTIEQLYVAHNSIPANPLLAEALYLYGTIERMGTGTEDMAKRCLAIGLKLPLYSQNTEFRTILYRNNNQVDVPVTPPVTPPVTKLIDIFENEMSRQEIQMKLELADKKHFLQFYLQPAIEQKIIGMTIPDKPNSRLQKYRLTEKGIELKKILHTNK